MKNSFCVLTLGCNKNVVDSENLIGLLENNNFKFTEDISQAETLIINTCGFIKPSKEESFTVISEAIELKESGKIKKILVAGCLSERYKEELTEQMPEVDKFYGVNEFSAILNDLKSSNLKSVLGERHLLTPKHYAYLKISEGCNHGCAFCAIPFIRGVYNSRKIEDLVNESEILALRGVKELNVIAQDTTYYGKDIYGERKIAELLNRLSRIKDIEWIRLLYTYPTNFPINLLEEIASNPKICNYIDIPFQHVSDKMLKAMGRGTDKRKIADLIEKTRSTIKDVAIRSTFIVGFPDETEKDFRELYDFLEKIELDRVGIFTYSHEENTKAFELKDKVPEKIKKERRAILMELLQGISLKKNKAKIGKIQKVLLDSEDGEYFIGRTMHDAPEVDNTVLIKAHKKYKIGKISDVLITDAREYDIFGELV